MKIILASASPRRQELLKEIVSDFEILVANVDEEALVAPDPIQTAKRTARAKAEAVAKLRPDALIIAGDTVVAIDGKQLAKPTDEKDAFRMLRTLSGRTHTVITGICLLVPSSCGDVRAPEGEGVGGEGHPPMNSAHAASSPDETVEASPPSASEFQVQTQVTFRNLTDEEIWAYIATGEPMDKAGAYGAQGEAANLIAKIDGSLTNVIGLPVDELRAALAPILSKENGDRIGHEA